MTLLPDRPTRFSDIAHALTAAKVEFIIVGGVAAFAHGSGRSTLDFDVVYRRTPDNIRRVVEAVRPFQPYPRGAPPGLPFQWDERAVRFGSNFTLETSLGWIGLLGEITGGGSYDDLLPRAMEMDVWGVRCLCLDLPTLIHVKRAAGRPKDFEAIGELELLRDKQRKSQL